MKKPGVKTDEQSDSIIRVTVSVPAEIKEENDMFYASCWPLDVHSQGNTGERAKMNLSEALRLFIESCFERGVLNQVLKEQGFVTRARVTGDDSSGQASSPRHRIDVPLDLLIANHVRQAVYAR